MVIPMAASAATLKMDMLCSTGPGTPLFPFFLAGQVEINEAGDLTLRLDGVRPSVSRACQVNCVSMEGGNTFRGVRVDNCGVSDERGTLNVQVPGIFAPILEANDGLCPAPFLNPAPESGMGQVCFNGFGEVE